MLSKRSMSVDSSSTRNDSSNKLNTYIRTSEAAQRVFDNLGELIKREKSSLPNEDAKSVGNDSGIVDESLDSYRAQTDVLVPFLTLILSFI